MVTVAMVTYNSEKYLSIAIESVLASSYTNFELVICDDCSTDSSWNIITKYNDSRIRAFRNDNNIGEYPNRNKALNHANGEYILFIDGDDVIYPHGLEFMVRMLSAFPNCGMALMRWYRNSLIYPVVITPNQFYIGEYFGNGFLGTAFSNVLFKTSILKQQGGLPNNYAAGDDYVRYQIALTNNSLLINDGLTWWRETPGQASERHKNTTDSCVASYKIRLYFLSHLDCPLTEIGKTEALFNLYKEISSVILNLIFKCKYFEALKLSRIFNLPLSKLIFYYFKNTHTKNPFEGYTPAKPLMLEFNKNPYSSNF